MTPAVECRDLSVRYGDVVALDGIDITVAAGETLAVLGPSGSGKTTLLFAVAGFVPPIRGEIRIGGRTVSAPGTLVPPEARRVGMVFQHYALWPHLNAMATVAYPLRRAGLAGRDAARRATELLERLEIAHLADRRPDQLSGGQQQRVGLARALASDAVVYLFDEPTAHLDAWLRTAVQQEIAHRRRDSGASAIYATHDAAEALATADTIALVRDGRLAQQGSPRQIYEEPADVWSARLTGPASVLTGPFVRVADGLLEMVVESTTHRVAGAGPQRLAERVLVRPEWTRFGGTLPGKVVSVEFRGPHTDHGVISPLGEVTIRASGPPSAGVGETVRWTLDRVWPVDG